MNFPVSCIHSYARFGLLLTRMESEDIPTTQEENDLQRHPSLTDSPFTPEEALAQVSDRSGFSSLMVGSFSAR